MGILLNEGINLDRIISCMINIIAIITLGWYIVIISKYIEKRKRVTRRIKAVVVKRETSMLIWVRSFRPVYYYVYTFTGLDEYEGITFYDKSVKLEEQFRIGENVFLHINPENLGQFFVENATEPDKGMIFGIILIGLIIIQYLL